jgi:hypothetical protein
VAAQHGVMQNKMNKRKNYIYIFWICFAIFLFGILYRNIIISLLALIVTFLIILIIQLNRGYTLTRSWKEGISKREKPVIYWLSIFA